VSVLGNVIRHCHDKYNTDSGYTFVNYDSVRTERLISSASSLSDSEYPIDDVDELQYYDSHPEYPVDDVDELQYYDSHPSSHHKKVKKKSKHSRHGSRTRESSHKHAKRKINDVDSNKHKKKKKKKRKRKKSNDGCSVSLCHVADGMSCDKRRSKLKHLKHRSRHRSKLSSSQEEPPTKVSKFLNCDRLYNKLQSPDLPDSLVTPKSSASPSASSVSSCERQTAVLPYSPNGVYGQL